MARAGVDGRFSIDVDPRRRYKLTASAEGYAIKSVGVDVGEPKTTAVADLVLVGGFVIRGRVEDEAGNPIPASTIVVSQRVNIRESVLKTSSVFSPDGRFEIADVPEGDYLVSAAAYGFAISPSVPASAVSRQSDPSSEEGVVIKLPKGGTLVGRVIDGESKAPLSNARVTAENSMGGRASAQPIVTASLTDDDGNFELEGLQPGKASVVASAYKHHSRIVGGMAVTSGARIGPIEIELTATKDGEEPMLELAGLGASLTAADDGLVIQGLIDGGGAIEAGLAVGDIILAIDGARVTELGFAGAIQQIRGPVNTKLMLTIRRAGGDELEMTATRRKIRT